MKKQGVRKAKDDLAEAKRASFALQSASSLTEAEAHWQTFVEKFGRFFNKLAAAAKGDAKSEGWFAKINKERNSDDLLSYLLQARNCIEHTIEDITEKRTGYFAVRGNYVHVEWLEINSGGIKGSIKARPDLTIINEPPKIALLDVKNRGKTYSVPTSHLGSPIAASPQNVSILAIQHGETLLAEAERRSLA